jgi:hypothetical protein
MPDIRVSVRLKETNVEPPYTGRMHQVSKSDHVKSLDLYFDKLLH